MAGPVSDDTARNGIVSLTNILNSLVAAVKAAFPVFTTTATSATAGTNGAVPAQVSAYLNVTINGTAYKIPLFNP